MYLSTRTKYKKNSQIWTILLLFAIVLGACSSTRTPPLDNAETNQSEVEQAAQASPTNEPTDMTLPTEAPPSILVIHNGMVITATGEEPIEDGVVVIEGEVITAVGSKDDVPMPDGARFVDAQGGTILPGIIDARASDLLNRLRITDGQINYIDLEIYLTRALKAGLTTVRATGWDWRNQPDVVEMKAALHAHGNTIPTVVIAGPFLTHVEGSSYQRYPDQTIGVATVEEAKQKTEMLIEMGVDQIGYILSLPPSGSAVLTSEQQEAIVEAAHAQGVRVIGQAVFPDEAALVVAAGADEIPSWPTINETLPEDLIDMLASKSIPIITGYTVGEVKPQPGDARRFLDAGGTIVFGTFAPNSNALNNFSREMELMSLVGELTSMEIIEAATVNAAEAVGRGDEIGTLEAGKMADIIIVDGNPLEDLTVFRNGIITVIKGGELIPLDS